MSPGVAQVLTQLVSLSWWPCNCILVEGIVHMIYHIFRSRNILATTTHSYSQYVNNARIICIISGKMDIVTLDWSQGSQEPRKYMEQFQNFHICQRERAWTFDPGRRRLLWDRQPVIYTTAKATKTGSCMSYCHNVRTWTECRILGGVPTLLVVLLTNFLIRAIVLLKSFHHTAHPLLTDCPTDGRWCQPNMYKRIRSEDAL